MPAIEALIHQQPGNGIFDNVPDGAEIGAVPVASCPDQGQNPAHAAVRAIILAVVTGISDQVADIGTDDQCPIEQMAEQPGVVDVGRRGDRRQGQAVGIHDKMVFGTRFAAVSRVRADEIPAPFGANAAAVHHNAARRTDELGSAPDHPDQAGLELLENTARRPHRQTATQSGARDTARSSVKHTPLHTLTQKESQGGNNGFRG
jgi:hypothetical protein